MVGCRAGWDDGAGVLEVWSQEGRTPGDGAQRRAALDLQLRQLAVLRDTGSHLLPQLRRGSGVPVTDRAMRNWIAALLALAVLALIASLSVV